MLRYAYHYYVTISNPGDVYWYDFDTGQALLVNADSAGNPLEGCRSPVVSPDGRCVAFCCDADVGDLVPGLMAVTIITTTSIFATCGRARMR